MALPATGESKLTVIGENLNGATAVWSGFAARFRDLQPAADGKRCTVSVEPFFAVNHAIGVLQLVTPHGVSNPHWISFDDFLTIPTEAKSVSMNSAQTIDWPVAVEGGMEEGRAHYFRFEAGAGQRLTFDVMAARAGSALDPVLRLLDSRGGELAYSDDAILSGVDPQLSHRFETAGLYFLELRDARYQGGARFHYRLRIGDFDLERSPYLPMQTLRTAFQREYSLVEEVEPNDSAESATSLSLPALILGRFHSPGDRDIYRFEAAQGARLIFGSRSRSLGSPCDLRMSLRTLKGERLAEANVSGAGETSLTNTFKTAGTYLLEVEELNGQGGRGFFYEVEARSFRPGFTLNVETNLLHAAPGGEVKVKVTAVRSEYTGSITLQALGNGVAWEVEDFIIPENGNEAQLRITVPPNSPTGRARHIQVIGTSEGSNSFLAVARTAAQLRRWFPNQVHPPRELDGWISVGVTEAAMPQEEAPASNK